MDDALLAPPLDYATFARQVEHAAGRRLNLPLDREARLVFEVWQGFGQTGFGERAVYAEGLARWLDDGDAPVYSLGLAGLSRLEQRFLDACRARRGLKMLPVDMACPDAERLLQEAWLPSEVTLRERAHRFGNNVPASPLAEKFSVLAAPDMESEARTVANRIKSWLAEGRRDIAVIALDRMAARRLRAVLERDAILMQDETGWTFSTATVSHVLDRWFMLLQDNFYHRDLLDFLKSPFVFDDLAPEARLDAVSALEKAIAQRNAVYGLEHMIHLAGHDECAALLVRMQRATSRYRTTRGESISGWIEILLATLLDLGALDAIEADDAGRQLLDLLRRLKQELAAETGRLSLASWRGWLNLQLDRAVFQDSEIESPIRLTHLAAARLRDFDAVVILGADAGHLPPKHKDAVLGEGLRRELGLPGLDERLTEARDALIDVLSRAGRVLLSRQSRRGQEPNAASPWLLLLEAFHELAYGAGLPAEACVELPHVAGCGQVPAAPRLTALPERLSASAWQKLVSCPYRYFAHYGLGLGEADMVAEEMEKADYGELLHEILGIFHGRHPVLADTPKEALLAELTELGRQLFGEREKIFYLASGWRLRWERHAKAYLDWALGYEAQGWHWQESEREYERELELLDGRQLTLFGRLDRLDVGAQGRVVLDYKSQSRQRLREKLALEGEDVQLPFYGLLTGAERAGLVALDDDKVDMIGLDRPLAEVAGEEADRLRRVFADMAGGAAMPANGSAGTCAWCEMRGLCRKEHDNVS